jgi:hypothetical protein
MGVQNAGDRQPWQDGNRNRLFEWGTACVSIGRRGFLDSAKWESGLDFNSPMLGSATQDPHTYTMDLDALDLVVLCP